MLIFLLLVVINNYEPINPPLDVCLDDYHYLLFDSFGVIKLDSEGYKIPCKY